MKPKRLLIGNIIGAVLILFGITYSIIISGLFQSLSEASEASAIGVIGGADGPTAIFISGNYDFNTIVSPLLLLLFVVEILLIFNIVYLVRNK
jgi:Na+-transporting methylmalonyl-CoA/oxaloacetate decarboxylase beta subunit